MTDAERLQERIWRLEQRLEIYHARLETCLDHDRRFQLGATWGILNTAIGWGAFFGTIYASKHWLHLDGWFWEFAAGVVGFIAFGIATTWSDKGREGDLQKLSRLPEWDNAQ